MTARATREPRNTDQPGLQAQLLGALQLRYHDRLIPEGAFRRRRALTLLLNLLLAPNRQLSRDIVLERLWPEDDPGASADNLNTVVSALRAALGGGSQGSVVLSRGGSIALAPELHVAVDVAAFEEAATAALTSGEWTALRAAAALYRGPLLPNLPYADWVERRRESLARLHRRLLTALAAAEAATDPDAAEERLHALLHAEPTNEAAARRLMRLLGARGQRADAVRVYERLQQALQADLDLAPSPKTQEIYAAFRTQPRQDAAEVVAVEAEGAGGDAASLVPAIHPLPTGMLTFLTTGVVGSTLLWEQHPAAMQAALARHDQLVRHVLSRHGSRQITERGEGESIVTVFTSVSVALAAACDLQQALMQEPWPSQTPLRVRMSLHTGEAAPHAGRYDGVAVNRAVRIRELAHGGQILVSRTTHDLLRDTLPDGCSLLPLGGHLLSGLERPEEIYQVCHPRLLSTFPSLLSRQAPKHNLPRQMDAFIGRRQAQAEVADLLDRAALVTLTGSGGVGKTRLALAVAAQLVAAYPDGVWLVELAPLVHPSLLPGAVAHALGLREEPGRDLLVTLADHLRERRMLLLLDNCEHLLEACAGIASTLLHAAHHLQILATSRERLSVTGEVCYRVPSLSVPDPRMPPPRELIPAYEAVRLFVARAQAIRRDFTPNEQNAVAIAAICVRLDGIPLAIELAAARIGALSVEAIADRLDERFQLLTAGPRDALPRQQTLRATLDWSWALLSETERSLLRRLSIFANGWTLPAAEAVCHGEDLPPHAVLDVLVALVAKSLVQVPEQQEEARYSLLETVQQYARDRLIAAGEEQGSRDQHLHWCMALAEEAAPGLLGAEQRAWLVRLDREHDNLRAALAWAQEREASEQALRLAGALWRFWAMRGHHSEGRRWLEAALADRGTVSAASRATALNGAGNLAWQQADYTRATMLHEEALALRRALEDTRGIAGSLSNLGTVAYRQGNYRRATTLYEEALARLRQLEDRWGVAGALNNLAMVAYQRGDYVRAASLYEEGLALQRALQDEKLVAASLDNLGLVMSRLGDHGRAVALQEESLAMQRSLRDTWGTAVTLGNLGTVVSRQGDTARAAALQQESLALLHEIGDRHSIAVSLSNLGEVAAMEGAYERALALYEEGLALQRQLGDQHGSARSLTNLGTVAYLQGNYARAATLFAEGLALSRDLGARDQQAEGLEGLAWVAAATGQAPRAARLGGAAQELREALDAPLQVSLRAGHARAVQAMHEALDERAFASAWAEGQAMPPEEALALALDEHTATPQHAVPSPTPGPGNCVAGGPPLSLVEPPL